MATWGVSISCVYVYVHVGNAYDGASFGDMGTGRADTSTGNAAKTREESPLEMERPRDVENEAIHLPSPHSLRIS